MPSTVRTGRKYSGAKLLFAAVLTAGVYTLVHLPGMQDTTLYRYTTGHWVEYVSVALFCFALADLLAKLVQLSKERAALRHEWLPSRAGEPQPITSAVELYGCVAAGPDYWQGTYIASRLRAALLDIREKKSTEQLEDHLRYLADQDADRSHASFSLCRVIAWMIPILGFLGTVIGITLAIANITPSQLETSLPEVTGGLAVAFDTTALALGLSIGLMLLMSLVEGSELRVLSDVEATAHRELAYRFLPNETSVSPYLAQLQATGEAVIEYTRKLVDQQSQIWSHTVSALQQQAHHSNKALEERLHKAVTQWQSHFHDQGQALTETARAMSAIQSQLQSLSQTLAQVVQGEGHLLHSQERLAQNLAVLQQTQAFDETLNALTAAIHLLTMRHQPPSISQKNVA